LVGAYSMGWNDLAVDLAGPGGPVQAGQLGDLAALADPDGDLAGIDQAGDQHLAGRGGLGF
jgi:hypothetical protein